MRISGTGCNRQNRWTLYQTMENYLFMKKIATDYDIDLIKQIKWQIHCMLTLTFRRIRPKLAATSSLPLCH